jgi:hypothetical protein
MRRKSASGYTMRPMPKNRDGLIMLRKRRSPTGHQHFKNWQDGACSENRSVNRLRLRLKLKARRKWRWNNSRSLRSRLNHRLSLWE